MEFDRDRGRQVQGRTAPERGAARADQADPLVVPLVVLGALRLARTARVRWEPVSLLAGALITAAGFAIPAVGWAFLLGLLALIVTLLRGISGQQRRRGPVHRMGPTL